MNGFLLVDKKSGISSSQVVQKVKKKLSLDKVGHLGTLDLEAEGLLVLAINRATKFSNYFLSADKSYYVEIRFGIVTDSDDASGNVIKKSKFNLSQNEVKKEVQSFLGVSMQKPPFYSALKYKGKPLYKYARKGEFIKKDARKIEVKRISKISLTKDICSFEIKCTKGTYIRSIARDLGEKIGCGAHMKYLRRLSQEKFLLNEALPIDQLTKNKIIKIEDAFSDYKKISLDQNQVKVFVNGGKIKLKKLPFIYRVFDEKDEFIGLGELVQNHLKHKQLV